MKSEYSIRNKHLKNMGFKKYKRYLKSKLWKSIRLRVLQRDSFRCYSCRGKATQVHHKKYSLAVLSGQRLDQLVSICRRCHKTIEFFFNGKKTTVKTANRRLKDIKNGKLNKRVSGVSLKWNQI